MSPLFLVPHSKARLALLCAWWSLTCCVAAAASSLYTEFALDIAMNTQVFDFLLL